MVVDDLNVIYGVLLPSEANSKLSVDPDAVLPHPIPLQSLKVICRRDGQIIQESSGLEG